MRPHRRPNKSVDQQQVNEPKHYGEEQRSLGMSEEINDAVHTAVKTQQKSEPGDGLRKAGK